MVPKKNYLIHKRNKKETHILSSVKLRRYNPEEPLDDAYREARWQMVMLSSYDKMTFIDLHGKQSLEDQCLIHPSCPETTSDMMLPKVLLRKQRPLFYRSKKCQ